MRPKPEGAALVVKKPRPYGLPNIGAVMGLAKRNLFNLSIGFMQRFLEILARSTDT